MPTTFTAMRDRILAGARRVGGGFTRPDDDWRPMLFIVQGLPRNLAIVPLVGVNTPERRDHFFNVALPLLVRFAGAECLGLLNSVWFKEISYAGRTIEQARRDLPESIHADPERQKMLWVEISDGEEDETWTAKIRRRPEAPPLLDEWELMPGQTEHEGRMGRACYRAFHAEPPTDPWSGHKYDPLGVKQEYNKTRMDTEEMEAIWAAENDDRVADVHRKMPDTHAFFSRKGLLGFPAACPLCRRNPGAPTLTKAARKRS